MEKETSPLQPLSIRELREDLTELLEYVAKQNEVSAKPHHKDIEKKLHVTRTTEAKVEDSVRKGLVVEKRKGRLKVVEITERGKKTINLQKE